MRRGTMAVIVVGVLLIALMAGCGSKKKTASGTTTTTAGTTAGQGSGSGSGSKSFASAKNCKDLEGLAAKISQAFQTSASGENGLSQEADTMNALADAAPSEIKDDFKTFADAFKQFAKEYGDVNLKPGETPTATQLAKLAEISKSFNTAKLQQATQHLAAWGKSHCGLSSTG